jgi:hypothetical protein
MHAERLAMRRDTKRGDTAKRWVALFCLLAGGALAAAQTVGQSPAQSVSPASALTPAQAETLVEHALANELKATADSSHPMRYVLRKTSPRLTATKEIIETRDGEVALLIAINDQPLSAADEQKEQARLDALLENPGLQRHRKQGEDADAARALKVLRVLPSAFLYQYAGPMETPAGTVERYTFKPNPGFTPQDLETEVLTAMSGEIRIDPASERVTHLEGRLEGNVDIGWGFLGRLNKGGWITIDEANVCGDAWRTVHLQMSMSGRVFFRTRVFDTTEDESRYAPLPEGLDYAKAIGMLRATPDSVNTLR